MRSVGKPVQKSLCTPPGRWNCLIRTGSGIRSQLEGAHSQGHSHYGEDSLRDQKWQDLRLLKRKLEVSISEEDFLGAASLRDSVERLTESMSATEQYTLKLIQSIRESPNLEERIRLLKTIADVGDFYIIPDVAALLHDPDLCKEAENCMITLWHKHTNPEINRLMQKGSEALRFLNYSQALQQFEDVTTLDPSFAEGHNKKATVLYLMKKFEESIKVCLLVVDLQPYHFGALSGMGLCHYHLRQYQEAIQAFEQALFVNPGLSRIRSMAENLKKGNLPNI